MAMIKVKCEDNQIKGDVNFIWKRDWKKLV